jgi:hypothetical protein
MEASFCISLAPAPQLLSVSDGVAALLGLAPAEFVSGAVSLVQRIHPHDQDIAERLFADFDSPELEAVNLRLRHADGRIRCVRGEFRKTRACPAAPLLLELRLQDAQSLPRTLEDAALDGQLPRHDGEHRRLHLLQGPPPRLYRCQPDSGELVRSGRTLDRLAGRHRLRRLPRGFCRHLLPA